MAVDGNCREQWTRKGVGLRNGVVMPLLHWSTLEPHPPSNLAAVRFAAPIRVSSLRIFPTGVSPFAQVPDIIASTEPDAFFLQIFFNAQPIHPQQNKDKQRPVNELVPSLIAYSGGLVEFTVDMGAEYATRLMIVKGEFQRLSLAVYGDIVSEPCPVPVYEPKPLPVLEHAPLSKTVDPANSLDPSDLARKLLQLIPDSPSLSLVIRLMFCLKPSNDDWDHPEFPYLHAYIDSDDEAFDLEGIVQNISRPLPEDTTIDVLEAFAAKVADLIGPKDGDQAYCIAKLLNISASQFPEMARILLQWLDLNLIYDTNVLDEVTINHLLDAAASVDIARHFNNPSFLELLSEARDSPKTDKQFQYPIDRLLSRIRGWEIFEDALSNAHGDFYEAARLLKDAGTGEQSLGIWLESMIIHDDVSTKLADIVVPPSQITPPLLLSEKAGSVSHDEFIVFVRAFIGVASVLAVWAWSDSTGHDVCREQSLAILHLWQNVSGYREIVNHLLLLRQLTRRLGWITSDNSVPRNSGTLAERVLVNLAQEPHSILHDDLISTMLSLKPPLSYITDAERLTMRKVALVAEDGLSAALEEIAFKSDHPLSLRRLRTLRVSFAILLNSLDVEDREEWHAVDLFWSEQKQDLNISLIEIVLGISQDLNAHFSIIFIPGPMNQALTEQLFRTSEEALRVLGRLTATFRLNVRSLRTLVTAIVDVFACASTADIRYSQSSTAYVAAQETRQACLEFLHALSEPDVIVEPDRLGAEVLLETLLKYVNESNGRDPGDHVLQILAVIDFILPSPTMGEGEPTHWVIPVLPNVLTELKEFLRLLDVENRAHLLKRLIGLDQGTVGIGEWLLTEEMKHTLKLLEGLSENSHSANLRLVLQYELYLSLWVLNELIASRSNVATWCIDAIVSTDELSRTLTQCFTILLEMNMTCHPLTKTIRVMAEKESMLDEDLKRIVLLQHLRAVQSEGLYLSESMQTILAMLKEQECLPYNSDPLRFELARLLASLADVHSIIDATLAVEVVAILEWLAKQDHKGVDDEKRGTLLYGLTSEVFSQLCNALENALLSNPSFEQKYTLLTSLREKIIVRDLQEEAYRVPTLIELPETLQMSLGDVQGLLKRSGAEQEEEEKDTRPSTPKGVKTPDLLGVVISPPTAVLRSPAATGLTKTYVANDFRQLRQAPSSRLNTSRLPSMHVDEFEVTANTTPALMPSAIPDMTMLNMMGGN
ncbi:hypothetical protein APHAL10511_001637 [Amanita phalloides]|nr:hypothetical protein APHAL10511_001637 [Amanita phalloides]